MKDKELRKLIGSRAKQRRLELNLTQPFIKTDCCYCESNMNCFWIRFSSPVKITRAVPKMRTLPK